MGHSAGHTPPLPERECQLMAAYFHLLGNYNDLQLITALGKRERSVSELATLACVPQPLASRRLARLEQGGFAASRREGNHTYYILVDPIVLALCRRVRQYVMDGQDSPRVPPTDDPGDVPGTNSGE